MSIFTKDVDVDSIGLEDKDYSQRGSKFEVVKSGLEDGYKR